MGDGSLLVTGINEIHKVESGDLTFVDHPKYYDKALQSAATFIIINKEVDVPPGKALLYSNDPFTAYNTIVRKYRTFEPSKSALSETAKIGEGTIIQPGAFVGQHVVIGKNCLIHSNVSIYDHTIIGDDVIIHANTVIGADAFYFKRRPEGYDKMISCGRVIIHNKVEIGACCTIDKGVSGDTIIGQVGVQKDLTIGKGAVVLGKSGVPKSLEGGKTYFGSPTQEAREKMKELAFIKQLPSIIEKLKS